MKAGVASENGLVVAEVLEPQPGADEVLVRVHAAGLNRADLNAAKGSGVSSRAGLGKAIGMEWAGEVIATGANVKGIRPGERVLCSGSGGYAELAVCDAGRVLPMPAGMSFEQAGVLPLALLTMHDAVVTHGRLQAGESVLIQGASSGVGIMGMLIAKQRGAKLVIGSSTNEARRKRLAEFGADHAIDPRDPAWPEQVLEATGGKGVDLVVDMISGGVAVDNMKAAAVRGRIVNVGRLGGMKGEFDFDLHALKRIDYVGVTFRTRSIEEVREIVRRTRDDLWDAVTTGKLALPVDSAFPLDRAPEAHARMRANEHFGKIVLTV